jgi:hypothetical protein
MHVTFSAFGPQLIGQADVTDGEVVGWGNATTPQLRVPVRLKMYHGWMKAGEGLEIVSLGGTLWNSQGLRFMSPPANICMLLPAGQESGETPHYLDFPMDTARLAALEQLRAGGDVKFRLDCELILRSLRAVNRPAAPKTNAGVVWGTVQPHRLFFQGELSIPRDVWLTRVLPVLGYGVTHIVEFPAAPVESCRALRDSFTALKQAQEFHKFGLYDDAAGRCRVALERFFEYVEKPETDETTGKTIVRRVPILKKSWETRLGEAAYAWLDQTLGAIKEAANRPRQSLSAHYSQLDSQMILAITTAVVAYIARTVDPVELK